MFKRIVTSTLALVLLLGGLPAILSAQPMAPPPWLAVATRKAVEMQGVVSAQGMEHGQSHFMLMRTRSKWPCASANDLWQEFKARADKVLTLEQPECWMIVEAPVSLPKPNKSLLTFSLQGSPDDFDEVVDLAQTVTGFAAVELWQPTSDALPVDWVLAVSRTGGFDCDQTTVDNQLGELQSKIQGLSVGASCRNRCCYGILTGPRFTRFRPMPAFEYAHLRHVEPVPVPPS